MFLESWQQDLHAILPVFNEYNVDNVVIWVNCVCFITQQFSPVKPSQLDLILSGSLH